MRPVRSLLVLFALPLFAACGDLMGPITGIELEIRGPDKTYGSMQPVRYASADSTYTCGTALSIRAKTVAGDPNGYVVITGAILDIDGERSTIGADEAKWVFGSYVRVAQTLFADRLLVHGPRDGFRWQIELLYFDIEGGRDGSSTFSAQCV